MKVACCLVTPANAASAFKENVGFCRPYTWLFGIWVASPRLPLLADVNGDGYADFLYASPTDKLIDVSLNGHGLKPLQGYRFLQDLLQPVLGMCKGQPCGKAAAIYILGANGVLTKVLANEKGDYDAISLGCVAGINRKGWLVAGRLVSTDKDDLAAVTPDGIVRLMDSRTGKMINQFQLLGGVIGAAAGDSDGDGRAKLALQTSHEVTLYRLGKMARKMVSVKCPKGQTALAMGDVNADGKTDLLVNGCVFLGPDFRKVIPIDGWKSFSKPVLVFLADVNGDGKADVVVQHEGPDYYGSREADCDIYLTYRQSDLDWDDDELSNAEEAKLGTDPLNRDTDNDGLLDGWEVHGFDGFDFPGMGALPLHKDIFVMNVPTNGSPPDQIARYMRDTVVPFFAKLPYNNLDGKQGFAIHFTVAPSATANQTTAKGWEQLADELFPAKYIRAWHWVEIPRMHDGGQSELLSEVASSVVCKLFWQIGSILSTLRRLVKHEIVLIRRRTSLNTLSIGLVVRTIF